MVNFNNYTIDARIEDPKRVFFTKDGIDVNASEPKWQKYIPKNKENRYKWQYYHDFNAGLVGFDCD